MGEQKVEYRSHILEKGYILDEKYEIGDVIGEGGFAVTYFGVRIEDNLRVRTRKKRIEIGRRDRLPVLVEDKQLAQLRPEAVDRIGVRAFRKLGEPLPAPFLRLRVDAIINTAMNGGDPMTVQEPSASCTGSCSTCGGCH